MTVITSAHVQTTKVPSDLFRQKRVSRWRENITVFSSNRRNSPCTNSAETKVGVKLVAGKSIDYTMLKSTSSNKVANPHLPAAKRILWYFKDCPGLGITFKTRVPQNEG